MSNQFLPFLLSPPNVPILILKQFLDFEKIQKIEKDPFYTKNWKNKNDLFKARRKSGQINFSLFFDPFCLLWAQWRLQKLWPHQQREHRTGNQSSDRAYIFIYQLLINLSYLLPLGTSLSETFRSGSVFSPIVHEEPSFKVYSVVQYCTLYSTVHYSTYNLPEVKETILNCH